MKHLKFLPMIVAGMIMFTIASCKKESLGDNNAAQSSKTDLLNNPTEKVILASNFRNILVSTATYANKFDPTLVYAEINADDVAVGDRIWVHIENGDAKTMYQPRDWKHVDQGEEATKYEFPDAKHVEEGIDKTVMVPGDAEHKEDGYDKTHWYPPSWQHVPDGDNKTAHRMDKFEHISSGPNKSYFRPY